MNAVIEGTFVHQYATARASPAVRPEQHVARKLGGETLRSITLGLSHASACADRLPSEITAPSDWFAGPQLHHV